jgi:hypothetical protein
VTKFFLGVVFGIVIATIGFTGLARVADSAVNKTKETVQDLAK